jgi:hypothetical protein
MTTKQFIEINHVKGGEFKALALRQEAIEPMEAWELGPEHCISWR